MLEKRAWCGYVLIGMVMGGIQSLSRSTYAKLIPKTHNNAGYFSFYDVSEKLAMIATARVVMNLDEFVSRD